MGLFTTLISIIPSLDKSHPRDSGIPFTAYPFNPKKKIKRIRVLFFLTAVEKRHEVTRI
jgi:hypothetical protein